MNLVKGEPVRLEHVQDLKQFLTTAGPCLTVYMPLSRASNAGSNPNSKQNELQWSELLRGLETRVEEFGSIGRELIDSIRFWEAVAPESALAGETAGHSIVVLRSPDVFRVALMKGELPERAVIGPHFYIRPLIAELSRDRSFFLLALSQKNTRLLHCTTERSEEVPLPASTKTNFEEWMNQTKPDHTAVYNAMSGPSQGASGPNALAPKGADAEAQDEYLSHFYKQIARGVGEAIKGRSEPLVLCAVEYEIPMYREVNTYPNLAAEAVKGAPNGLKSGEMHSRALEVLEDEYNAKLEVALAEWNHKVGAGASSRLKEVVTAAHEGRVLNLIISDTQEKTGVFHEDSFRVQARQTGGAQDEDLVNDAAVQTLLHAGSVLIAPNHKMPNGDPVAAVYRY